MKKAAFILSAIIIITAMLSGCSQRGGISAPPVESKPEHEEQSGQIQSEPLDETGINLVQYQPVQAGDTIAVMETSMGTIRIRLFPELAPKTVANFVGLTERGYYNGKTFHRVVEEFMIQGGALDNSGVGGMSIYTDDSGNPVPFEDEFSTDLWNVRGAVSMANSGPNTNMSQFFIVQNSWLDDDTVEALQLAQFPGNVIEKYVEFGGAPHLDWRHTVFGQVIEGMDVVDEIARVPVADVINGAGEKVKGERPLDPIIILSATIEIVG